MKKTERWGKTEGREALLPENRGREGETRKWQGERFRIAKNRGIHRREGLRGGNRENCGPAFQRRSGGRGYSTLRNRRVLYKLRLGGFGGFTRGVVVARLSGRWGESGCFSEVKPSRDDFMLRKSGDTRNARDPLSGDVTGGGYAHARRLHGLHAIHSHEGICQIRDTQGRRA